MSDSGTDWIWSLPPSSEKAVLLAQQEEVLFHVCEAMSSPPRVCLREALDPCALGTCRYCGEELPHAA